MMSLIGILDGEMCISPSEKEEFIGYLNEKNIEVPDWVNEIGINNLAENDEDPLYNWVSFKKTTSNLLLSIFQTMILSKIKCDKCKKETKIFDPLLLIGLPLIPSDAKPEDKNMPIMSSSLVASENNNQSLKKRSEYPRFIRNNKTLYKCFDDFTEEEIMDVEISRRKCDECKSV